MPSPPQDADRRLERHFISVQLPDFEFPVSRCARAPHECTAYRGHGRACLQLLRR